MTFSPSRVLEQLDPIAFRCGVNDYADSLSLIEVGSGYYEQDECEKIKDELISELESEISDKEAEIEKDDAPAAEIQPELDELQEQLAQLKRHSF